MAFIWGPYFSPFFKFQPFRILFLCAINCNASTSTSSIELKIEYLFKHSAPIQTGIPQSSFEIQAALAIRDFGIRGFGIRGFDYSRTQKPKITRENFFS